MPRPRTVATPDTPDDLWLVRVRRRTISTAKPWNEYVQIRDIGLQTLPSGIGLWSTYRLCKAAEAYEADNAQRFSFHPLPGRLRPCAVTALLDGQVVVSWTTDAEADNIQGPRH